MEGALEADRVSSLERGVVLLEVERWWTRVGRGRWRAPSRVERLSLLAPRCVVGASARGAVAGAGDCELLEFVDEAASAVERDGGKVEWLIAKVAVRGRCHVWVGLEYFTGAEGRGGLLCPPRTRVSCLRLALAR